MRFAIEGLSTGDIEAAMALYEPKASFVGPGGEIVNGHDEVRQALLPFAAMKPNVEFEVERVIEADDIAVVCGRWSLEGTGTDGQPVRMAGRNVDVVRRQPDGSWRLTIDNPFFPG